MYLRCLPRHGRASNRHWQPSRHHKATQRLLLLLLLL
jgi:hypothetical protein